MKSKYRYFFLVAAAEAVYMILELIASRMISPYFGSSNIVWTAVIGVILFSSSIGNRIGGKLSDNEKPDLIISKYLFMAAIMIVGIAVFGNSVMLIIRGLVDDIRIGSIISALILFLPPSICFGTLIPVILKASIEDVDVLGKKSGSIYSTQTIGGIFGTFLGGFWLIPYFGATNILYALAIAMGLILFLTVSDKKAKRTTRSALIICVAIMAAVCKPYVMSRVGTDIEMFTKTFDTSSGRVVVYEDERDGEPIRVMSISGGFASATFIDEDKKYELVYPYTKYYDKMFEANADIQDVMMIGGAAYQYPKYYISHFPGKTMDVVEIDGDITDIAKEHFYLDDLISDYNLEQNRRLGLYTDDGRVFLTKTKKKYDAVLNDAFSGHYPVKTLTTVEAVQEIKSLLRPDGLYLSNIISSIDGDDSKFLMAEVRTIKQVFKNVYVFPVLRQSSDNDFTETMNIMVMATDDDIDFSDDYDITGKWEDAIILTDDYCPVDSLVAL